MNKKVRIAIDAMGGENSPKKIIEGIKISLKKSKENIFFLYGKKRILENELNKDSTLKNFCKIIDTEDVIKDDESPLAAAKRGKNSSMWKSIESQKNNETDILVLNTGGPPAKDFYDINSMNKVAYSKQGTENIVQKNSFVREFLSSLRQKMYQGRTK